MTMRLIHKDYKFEWKQKANGSGIFEGYASTFGNEDTAGDTVQKGAFVASLAKLKKDGKKVKMLWQHMTKEPIGVFNKAAEDNSGLYVEGQLVLGVQRANETHLLMQADAIDSMSIGGYVTQELYDSKTNTSKLIEIDLQEISPVTFPANTKARINTVKSIESFDMLSELETHLRDVGGFSYKEAKAIIAKARGCAVTARDVPSDAAQVLKAAIQSLSK